MRAPRTLGLLLAALAGAGCAAPCDLDGDLDADQCAELHAMALPEALPSSPGNAVADDAYAAYLGQQIFFDARFSANQDVRCATCHLPERAFGDGLPTSVGLEQVARNSPTALDVARLGAFFWDGRADSLWSQPLFAFEEPREMGFSRLEVAHRVARTYAEEYEKVFGALPPLDDAARFPAAGKPGDAAWEAMSAADRDAINQLAANVGRAIEAYERKLAVGRAPFDRFLAGDQAALDEPARRGMVSFVALGCAGCHGGPLLSDGKFHNLGVPAWPGVDPDRGRVDAIPILEGNPFRLGGPYADGAPAVPVPASAAADLGAFRTPGLRNVARTAPYAHNGRFASLADAVSFHLDGGGRDHEGYVGEVDPKLRAKGASAEVKADLVAFLGALTGEPPTLPWNDWPAKN